MTTIPTAERVVDVKEAAARLGVTTWTIRNYIRKGKLTAYRLGEGHSAPIRLKLSEVNAMLRAVRRKEDAERAAREGWQ